ncbi:MAG: AraC family transcriptional regulator [Janthinobacterium lividum]
MKQIYRYLPLSDDVRSRSLYVIAGGSAHLPPDTPYPPSTHPQHHRFLWQQGRVLQEYQIIYITRGVGVLESKTGGLQDLKTGDLFVLFPNEWHRYSPDPATGWDEHWVAFRGERTAEIMSEHGISVEAPLLHTDISELLLREFVRIEEEVAEEAIGYQNVVAARIQLILALAMASHQHQSFSATDVLAVIKRTKELLSERIERPTDMQEIADDLHVGYSWLRKMFRQYTGLPLAQYQNQLRLNHACELLRNTALPIAMIGTRSGFESAYYFARVFRSKMNCSPSEYRIQSRRFLSAEEDTMA